MDSKVGVIGIWGKVKLFGIIKWLIIGRELKNWFYF